MHRTFELKIMSCKRCEYQWMPRVRRPRVCPNCGSPYWDTPLRYPNRGRKRKTETPAKTR